MTSCCTVKSVEEEINKPNAFVSKDSISPYHLEIGGERKDLLHAGRELRRKGKLDRSTR